MWNTAPTIPGSNNFKQSSIGKLNITGGYIIGDYSSWKKPVRATTTVNTSLNGLLTIDGVELKTGDRVLVKNQDLPIQNGIYTVTNSSWYHSDDLPTGSSAAGIVVAIIAGFININKLFICTNDVGNAIVGISNLEFIEVSGGGGGNTNITWKEPVDLATTVDILLSGMRTIDGVTTLVNDRILVKNQTNQVENGIYLAKTGAWIRTADFSDGYDPNGSFVYVSKGNTNKEYVFLCNSYGIVGTDNITFVNLLLPPKAGGQPNYLQYNNNGVLDGVPGLAYTNNELVLGYKQTNFTMTTDQDTNTLNGGDLYILTSGSSNQFTSTPGNLYIESGSGYFAGGNIEITTGTDGYGANGGHVKITAGTTAGTNLGEVRLEGIINLVSGGAITLNATNGVSIAQNGISLVRGSVTVTNESQVVNINAKQGEIIFSSVSLAINTKINIIVNNTLVSGSQIILVNISSYTSITGTPGIQVVSNTNGTFTLQLANYDTTNPLSGTLKANFVIF
jgi:hypothetical protein